MSDLIEVTFSDGSTDIVDTDEAESYRKAGSLLDPVNNEEALTLKDMYGDDFNP